MSLLRPGLIFALTLAAFAHAAPLTRNLGQGLAYVRVHELPGDLPTAEDSRRQPCVLDLRYVTGRAEEAATLAAWLKFHATPHAPVLVLVNAETGRPLLAVIAPHGAGPSVVVIGAASPTFTPDIALKVSADEERRAYDALEHGTLVDALITEKPDKPRNDEAKLATDRVHDASSAPVDESAAIDGTPPAPPKPKPPAPLVDAVLQRAVPLHRALLALKKI